MSWLAVADRLAKKLVLDRLPTIDPSRSRTLRWWPLAILLSVTIGYVMIVSLPGRVALPISPADAAMVIVPNLLFFTAFAVSSSIRLLGPRLGSALGGEMLDERERAIRARAFALSGSFISWGAVIGCFWFGFAPIFGGWMPGDAVEWMYLGMTLWTWLLTLPVLIASWLQPRLADEA